MPLPRLTQLARRRLEHVAALEEHLAGSGWAVAYVATTSGRPLLAAAIRVTWKLSPHTDGTWVQITLDEVEKPP
jgi:hypothetical protein